jgi:hypothetical protein
MCVCMYSLYACTAPNNLCKNVYIYNICVHAYIIRIWRICVVFLCIGVYIYIIKWHLMTFYNIYVWIFIHINTSFYINVWWKSMLYIHPFTDTYIQSFADLKHMCVHGLICGTKMSYFYVHKCLRCPHTYTCMTVHTCTVCTYIHTYIHACIHTYIYIYIHTYT